MVNASSLYELEQPITLRRPSRLAHAFSGEYRTHTLQVRCCRWMSSGDRCIIAVHWALSWQHSEQTWRGGMGKGWKRGKGRKKEKERDPPFSTKRILTVSTISYRMKNNWTIAEQKTVAGCKSVFQKTPEEMTTDPEERSWVRAVTEGHKAVGPHQASGMLTSAQVKGQCLNPSSCISHQAKRWACQAKNDQSKQFGKWENEG